MRYLFILWAVALISCTGSGNKESIKRRMALIDQLYVPSLALTNAGNATGSNKALSLLQEHWDDFEEMYAMRFSPQQRTYLDSIARFIQYSRQLTNSGKLAEAHEALEHVRWLALELRNDLDIDYYLDGLTLYHDTMEQLVKAARISGDSTASAKIDSLYPIARRKWENAARHSPDTAAFGLSVQDLAGITKAEDAETAALDNLGAALTSDDIAGIRKSATDLRPPFVQLFKSFGNFEAVSGKQTQKALKEK